MLDQSKNYSSEAFQCSAGAIVPLEMSEYIKVIQNFTAAIVYLFVYMYYI